MASRPPVEPPGAGVELEPEDPREPRERTMPAGRVLVLMVAGLAIAGLVNAEAIARSSNAQHADSWRADVAGFVERLAGPLTWPRERVDVALGRDESTESIEDLEAQKAERAAGASTEGPATTTTTLPDVRVPTAAEPLRLYAGGDSMAQEFAKSMAGITATTGVINTTPDAHVSTGLTRPDYFNWPAYLVNDILPSSPEVLVLLFGANDAQGMELDDGRVLERFTPEWLDEYRRRVAGTMDLLEGDNRLTFWVGMPIMDPTAGVAGQDMLNHIYWSEAGSRPWIVYVDSWPYFADENGNYQQRLPAADGSVQGVRQADGVHWSKWGADRIAWEVLQVIEDHVDLSNGTVEYPPDAVAPDDIAPRDEVPEPDAA